VGQINFVKRTAATTNGDLSPGLHERVVRARERDAIDHNQ
jgi:hypothetical protein